MLSILPLYLYRTIVLWALWAILCMQHVIILLSPPPPKSNTALKSIDKGSFIDMLKTGGAMESEGSNKKAKKLTKVRGYNCQGFPTY